MSRYITALNRTSELNVIVVWICYELLFSISSVWIYYGTQSDIRVKSYCGLNLLRASVFNLEHLDILLDSIAHPSKKSLSFEFAQNICFQFWASQYITGLNSTSQLKVIVFLICLVLLFCISSDSIYYGSQSDIGVKSYYCLNFLRASVFNYECLEILRDSIGNLSKKLLSLELTQSFCFQFQASRYSIGLNQTSELKVIVVWISYELPFSITSVSIYYGRQSYIRVKSYCRLNLLRGSFFNFRHLDILQDSIRLRVKSYCGLHLLRDSIFNFECLDILRDSIGHLSKMLLSLEFA